MKKNTYTKNDTDQNPCTFSDYISIDGFKLIQEFHFLFADRLHDVLGFMTIFTDNVQVLDKELPDSANPATVIHFLSLFGFSRFGRKGKDRVEESGYGVNLYKMNLN